MVGILFGGRAGVNFNFNFFLHLEISGNELHLSFASLFSFLLTVFF